MDPQIARAITLLAQRLKRLEDIIPLLAPANASESRDAKDAVPMRAQLLDKSVRVTIPEDVLSGSPLLLELYTKESLALTQHCVGLWPGTKNLLTKSLCVTCPETVYESDITEEVRALLIPELLKAQVPFCTTQTDPSEEAPRNKLKEYIDAASSHVVIDSAKGKLGRALLQFFISIGLV